VVLDVRCDQSDITLIAILSRIAIEQIHADGLRGRGMNQPEDPTIALLPNH
jgi:hypothetical protein